MNWIIATIVSFGISVVLAAVIFFIAKFNKIKIPTKSKAAIVLIILSIWLLAFFSAGLSENNTIVMLLTGFSLLILMIVRAVGDFLSYEKGDIIQKIDIIYSTTAILFVTVFLIYIIPDQDVRNIVTAVIAAFYGGVLTLMGVAWTINYTEKKRVEEMARLAKPTFTTHAILKAPVFDGVVQCMCVPETAELEAGFQCDTYFEIENSNKTSFEIKRIMHDGQWFSMEFNSVVIPSSKTIVNFKFNNYPELIFMEIEDEMGNMHYYRILPLVIQHFPNAAPMQHTIRGVVEVKKSDMEAKVSESLKEQNHYADLVRSGLHLPKN